MGAPTEGALNIKSSQTLLSTHAYVAIYFLNGIEYVTNSERIDMGALL